MSRRHRLEAGPERKTTAWRIASFFLGVAALLALVDFLGWIDVGARLFLTMLVLGIVISIPYGVAWAQGRAPEPRAERDPIISEVPRPEPGGTVVVVHPEGRRRRLRPKELSAGWYALYNIFWRAPVTIGDYGLTGGWRLVHKIMGFNGQPRLSDLPRPQSEQRDPPPDSEMF